MKQTAAPSIRTATESDLAALLEVQKAAFLRYTDFLLPEQLPPLNETLEQVNKDLLLKTILVAENGGGISGSIRYFVKAGVCIIERLSVLPKHQGKGVGRGLVTAVEKQVTGGAHKIYLETGLLAHNLLLFYTKLGYTGEAILRNHFGRHDWIVFSKFI
jgi:predicted N-acetyltransferase YhbS